MLIFLKSLFLSTSGYFQFFLFKFYLKIPPVAEPNLSFINITKYINKVHMIVIIVLFLWKSDVLETKKSVHSQSPRQSHLEKYTCISECKDLRKKKLNVDQRNHTDCGCDFN